MTGGCTIALTASADAGLEALLVRRPVASIAWSCRAGGALRWCAGNGAPRVCRARLVSCCAGMSRSESITVCSLCAYTVQVRHRRGFGGTRALGVLLSWPHIGAGWVDLGAVRHHPHLPYLAYAEQGKSVVIRLWQVVEPHVSGGSRDRASIVSPENVVFEALEAGEYLPAHPTRPIHLGAAPDGLLSDPELFVLVFVEWLRGGSLLRHVAVGWGGEGGSRGGI